jgi:hypothetical protein
MNIKHLNAILLSLIFIFSFTSCAPTVHVHKTMDQPDCLNLIQDTNVYFSHSDPSRSLDSIKQAISKSYPLLRQYLKNRLYYFAYKDSAIIYFKIDNNGYYYPYVYGNSNRIASIDCDTLSTLLKESRLKSIPNDLFTTHIKLYAIKNGSDFTFSVSNTVQYYKMRSRQNIMHIVTQNLKYLRYAEVRPLRWRFS